MDTVSSSGYAWGYIGSCVPFIVCIALILGGPAALGHSRALRVRVSFVIIGVWWLAFTVPLVRAYKQRYAKALAPGETMGGEIAKTIRGLGDTMRRIAHDKAILLYMVAFFFYIDGVHTVISMATTYGTSLGLDSTALILALLVTQFVAFPSAIAYGRLAGKYGTLRMIIIAVVAYVCIVLFAAFYLKTEVEFWILAVAVGLFQGGIQALSRSYFGKLIPKERANEYYGFFDIFGRYASVLYVYLLLC